MEKIKLEYFKTINLYDVYGMDIFETKTTTQWENLCMELISGLKKTENYEKNRGDFQKKRISHYGKHRVLISETFFDHKNCKVVSENVGGRDYFIKVKYSNVLSKMWIQMAMRELDEIMKHTKLSHKILIQRYKTEFTIEDLKDIDNELVYQIKEWNRNGVKFETNSYCLKYKIGFYDFCNQICKYNIRKYSDLLLIHDRPHYDKVNISKDRKGYVYDHDYFSKNKQYLLTPIKIDESLTYLDYIGFGGFKVVVCKFKSKRRVFYNKNLKPLFDEIDTLVNIIKHQNSILAHNQFVNFMNKEIGNYNYTTKDKWNLDGFDKVRKYPILLS
jgi:hypothetical protein